ncbi:hypothetical protein RRG08_026421 [Elysia crispata]|uniref:Uncharacterized protein n=1 Tax=Elysia crispata TaxID=231223 RepID=A0AAE1CJJ4_9GAST|nr:hypothetical protein RRG08_026421 [Elysia crispata]
MSSINTKIQARSINRKNKRGRLTGKNKRGRLTGKENEVDRLTGKQITVLTNDVREQDQPVWSDNRTNQCGQITGPTSEVREQDHPMTSENRTNQSGYARLTLRPLPPLNRPMKQRVNTAPAPLEWSRDDNSGQAVRVYTHPTRDFQIGGKSFPQKSITTDELTLQHLIIWYIPSASELYNILGSGITPDVQSSTTPQNLVYPFTFKALHILGSGITPDVQSSTTPQNLDLVYPFTFKALQRLRIWYIPSLSKLYNILGSGITSDVQSLQRLRIWYIPSLSKLYNILGSGTTFPGVQSPKTTQDLDSPPNPTPSIYPLRLFQSPGVTGGSGRHVPVLQLCGGGCGAWRE